MNDKLVVGKKMAFVNKILFNLLLFLIVLGTIFSAAATNYEFVPECGNGVCEQGETFNTCPKDCSEQARTYLACLFDDKDCENDTMKEEAINIIVILFIVSSFIYLKVKKFI